MPFCRRSSPLIAARVALPHSAAHARCRADRDPHDGVIRQLLAWRRRHASHAGYAASRARFPGPAASNRCERHDVAVVTQHHGLGSTAPLAPLANRVSGPGVPRSRSAPGSSSCSSAPAGPADPTVSSSGRSSPPRLTPGSVAWPTSTTTATVSPTPHPATDGRPRYTRVSSALQIHATCPLAGPSGCLPAPAGDHGPWAREDAARCQ
jgi:hypothetical protein